MFEVSIYSLVLFIHVASAYVLIGSALFAPLARRQMHAAASRKELLTALDLGHRATRFNLPSALVLLASGLYLGSFGWWTAPWFIVAVLAWICNATLAGRVVHRTAGALAEEVSRAGGGMTAQIEALRHSRAWTVAARVMLANDVAMLYLMMNKPGLAGTLVLLLAANAILVAPVFLRQGAPRSVDFPVDFPPSVADTPGAARSSV